jgi:phosphatidylserine decarboxylase
LGIVVRDGIYYGAGFAAAAIVVAWLAGWPWAVPLIALGAFIVFFFRDPERQIPPDAQLLVSPADGKVTTIERLPAGSAYGQRISIFLSVFDVHVNRAPVAGTVAEINYCRGKFGNAMRDTCAVENERNIVRIDADQPVAFAQIAGAIARRIVFWPKLGDRLERGQRVGLIKFGSRVDVWLPDDAEVLVTRGQHVKGGSSALARLRLTPTRASSLNVNFGVHAGTRS